MSEETTATPDPDGFAQESDQPREESKTTPVEPKRRGRPRKDAETQEQTSDQTESASDATVERGPLTPAQYDDDGWDDRPVQMRG